MTVAATFGGWVAAGAVAAVALLAWHALGTRREEVARACHELRGPIAAARLGLEFGSRSGELSAAALRAIEIELGRASLALEDLDGARHGRSGVPSVAPIDLRQLLADSVEAWRPAATTAGKTLRFRWDGGSVLVAADRLRLAQATGNLIANAIEHGGRHAQVRGSVDASGGRIEVSDDGAGMPAPLAELTRRARHGRGSHGRGLAIAAAIAGSHGGRLTAASTKRGARLVLELRPATHTGRTE